MQNEETKEEYMDRVRKRVCIFQLGKRDRNYRMDHDRMGGLTLRAIGARHGISMERVRQVLARIKHQRTIEAYIEYRWEARHAE